MSELEKAFLELRERNTKYSIQVLELQQEIDQLKEMAELGNCLAEQTLAWAKDKGLEVTTQIEKDIIVKWQQYNAPK